jgi:Lambda phage tail tube protein, TTP
MAAEKTIGAVLVNVDDSLTLANITKIGEIGVTSDEIEVTDLDSPSGYKEFIAGAKDAGEVALEGFVKSEDNMEALLDLAESQAVKEYTLTFVSGSVWTFDAFVKMIKEGEVTPDGVRKFVGSIRISGAPVYTPATPSV